MEDSGEVDCKENKVSLDVNKKRTLKTPAQVMALESFYKEHKFPTDEMKAQMAEQLGLTEKQISSWFCHRRLKDKRRDEAHANGRQDHSSGVIQDRGSGLRQDSCGSIKQGDYRNIDVREVESQRIYGRDLSAADITYECMTREEPYVGCTDDTSSGSSSLQDHVFFEGKDVYDMRTSACLTQNGAIMPMDPRGAKNMGYKPSGYLKVKSETENPAITAVKIQLGGHYREDGPPLGIEFDPLPPGAFEFPGGNPDNEPICVGDLMQCHSPEIPGVVKQPNPITRYEVHDHKPSSMHSYMEEGANCNTVHMSVRQDRKSLCQLKPKSSFLNSSDPSLGHNTYFDVNEESAGKASITHSNESGMSSKLVAEGMRSDSFSKHFVYWGGKNHKEQAKICFHGNDGAAVSKIARKNEKLPKPSNLILECSQSLDTEERGPPLRIAKVEKVHVEKKPKIEYHNPAGVKTLPTNSTRAANRIKVQFPQQECLGKAFHAKPLWANQIKGSSGDVPSSFSEDETADTSSSLD